MECYRLFNIRMTIAEHMADQDMKNVFVGENE